MKRKSILMTIVAVLFAGVAMGQAVWPASGLPADAASSKAADTMFFCSPSSDVLYPIDLGFDVAGLSLHPKYGEWSLYARSSTAAIPSEYDFGAVKNGGAGNAFKVVGTTIGGYIFKYVSNDVQCGLGLGEAFYVYVYILPADQVLSKDTTVCVNTGSPTFNVNVNNSFGNFTNTWPYGDLFAKAGVTFSYSPTTWTVDRSAADADSTYTSTLTVVSKPAGLNCAIATEFSLVVDVVSEITLSPLNYAICSDEITPGTVLGDRNPNVIFGRTTAGTYAPTTVSGGGAGWTPVEVSQGYKNYVYSYTDPCSGVAKTVTDRLTLVPTVAIVNDYWGSDTLLFCRTSNTPISLFSGSLFNDPGFGYLLPGPGKIKPQQAWINNKWEDRGTLGTKIPYNAGTVSNNPSLLPGTNNINLGDMVTGAYYNYIWRIDPSVSCFGGDSGRMVIRLQDPFVATTFRAQMCENYTTPFDLGKFTGMSGATWTYVGPLAASVGTITGNNITVAQLGTMGKGTHKLKYDIAATCGASGSDFIYLKITDSPVVPSSTTKFFCKTKLPDVSMNLNELVNLVDGIQWSVVSATNQAGVSIATAVNAALSADGILSMPNFTQAINIAAITSANPVTLKFKQTNTVCGVSNTELTIVITDNIIN